MLDNRYTYCDFLKFYYNVKVRYSPQKRNMQIPIVFLVSTFISLLIINGLIKFNEMYLYIIEGFLIGLMLITYLTLLIPQKQLQK